MTVRRRGRPGAPLPLQTGSAARSKSLSKRSQIWAEREDPDLWPPSSRIVGTEKSSIFRQINQMSTTPALRPWRSNGSGLAVKWKYYHRECRASDGVECRQDPYGSVSAAQVRIPIGVQPKHTGR